MRHSPAFGRIMAYLGLAGVTVGVVITAGDHNVLGPLITIVAMLVMFAGGIWSIPPDR